MKIEITYSEAHKWTVFYDGKIADRLQYEEMLGLIAVITMPQARPCLNWLNKPKKYE